jgi:hypothetical protein
VAITVCAFTAAAPAALDNASFELAGSESVFLGWSQFGLLEPPQHQGAQPMDGQFHATMWGQDLVDPITGAGISSVTGVHQDLPAEAGQTWIASGWVMHPHEDSLGGNNQAQLRLEFRGPDQELLAASQQTILTLSSPTDVYLRGVRTLTAPAGSLTVRIVLQFYNCSCIGSRDGMVYYDLADLRLLGDADRDGDVDVDDLLAVIMGWGSDDHAADVNQDGVVDVDDLLAVITHWS